MIRGAAIEDVSAIRRLMESEPEFWQDHWSDATIADAIEAAGDLALVWDDTARIVGFACAHDLGFRGYLSELIVHPEVRRRGIGRSLVERIQAELARRGRRVPIVDAWSDAEPFYRSLGWTPPDVVLLRRALGEADR